MPSKKCCISKCCNSGESHHRFPNPQKYMSVFLDWVKICANPRLYEKHMTPEIIYNNCRVCSLHFTKNDFSRNNRLNKYVIPRINIPGVTEGNLQDQSSTGLFTPENLEVEHIIIASDDNECIVYEMDYEGTSEIEDLLQKKSCKHCKQNIDICVNCAMCGALFHLCCSKSAKSCCDEELVNKQVTDSASTNREMDLKEENTILKGIIKDKETIIRDKEQIIILLQDKLALLQNEYNVEPNHF